MLSGFRAVSENGRGMHTKPMQKSSTLSARFLRIRPAKNTPKRFLLQDVVAVIAYRLHFSDKDFFQR